MSSAEILPVVSIFFLSTVKFLFAPASAVAAGFGLGKTIIVTSLGGMTGISFFYYLGSWAISKIEGWRKTKVETARESSRVFTRKNRFIIRLKVNFGLLGLILLTPAILSIPIGCVVAAKFYRDNRLTYPLLLLSTCLWSVGLSLAAVSVKNAIFL